jgi:hypothetical protein
MREQYFAPFVCFQTWHREILYHVVYLRSLHLNLKCLRYVVVTFKQHTDFIFIRKHVTLPVSQYR